MPSRRVRMRSSTATSRIDVGADGSPSWSSHGRMENGAGEVRSGGRTRGGAPTGPVCQRSSRLRSSTDASWRTSRCRRSPGSISVEPRGRIAWSPRMITLSRASRGSPVSRTRWPTIACARSTGNSTTSAPSRRTAPTSSSASGSADSLVVTFSRAASASNVVPCTTVDTSTAKKTMLKNSTLPAMPAVIGNVASTTGTAPRRPAQPRTTRSATPKPIPSVDANTPSGRATTTTMTASTVPLSITSGRSDGNTSSPSARNMTTCASQPMPEWKVTMVRLAGICALPSARPTR